MSRSSPFAARSLSSVRLLPACAVAYRLADGSREHLGTTVTNSDGRCDAPILKGDALTPGEYELVFHAGDYLRAQGVEAAEPRFLDVIPLRFGVADASQHYHVPLLLSPYGYSTYRGS